MSVREPRADRYSTFDELLVAVRACSVCAAHLPLGPRPVLQAAPTARVLIVGQAPGARVHETGIPWDDPSGERLRSWMGIESSVFYDASRVAIIPMGFCYPGRGKGGDAPPRPECARLWHDELLHWLPSVELTLLVGLHAQRYFLRKRAKPTLSQTVRSWREYAPALIPLPHPSPRNQPWFARNRWFEEELVPVLRAQARSILEP